MHQQSVPGWFCSVTKHPAAAPQASTAPCRGASPTPQSPWAAASPAVCPSRPDPPGFNASAGRGGGWLQKDPRMEETRLCSQLLFLPSQETPVAVTASP